jgi:hypothetical protein
LRVCRSGLLSVGVVIESVQIRFVEFHIRQDSAQNRFLSHDTQNPKLKTGKAR